MLFVTGAYLVCSLKFRSRSTPRIVIQFKIKAMVRSEDEPGTAVLSPRSAKVLISGPMGEVRDGALGEVGLSIFRVRLVPGTRWP